MLCLNALVAVLVLITTAETCSTKFIKILSDFSNEEDVTFFRTTLPWIVENIGSKLRIDYHFKNQGNNTGIKECILMQMKGNTYFQATFLSLQAQEVQTNKAISNFPVNDRKTAHCLKRRIKNIMKTATIEFSKVQSEKTPIIILPGKRKISQVPPETILKEICALFGKRQPERCINPTPYPKQSKPQSTTHTNDEIASTITTEINNKGPVKENKVSTLPQDETVSNFSTLLTTKKDSSTTPIETVTSHNDKMSSDKMTETDEKVSVTNKTESTSPKEANIITLPTTEGDVTTVSTE